MSFIELKDLRRADGREFVLPAMPQPVCKPGEFNFAAVQFEHGHLNSMITSLQKAGATLKWIYDKNPENLKVAHDRFPDAAVARSLDEILDDPAIQLVCAADIPNDRAPLGFQCMRAGKHYFTDKTPFTSMEQLEDARRLVVETGKKYYTYFSERLTSEAAMLAGDLIRQGAIGNVLQVIGFGPHRLGNMNCGPRNGGRPDWFWRRKQYGGILCDIGSHQCEQFLEYANAKDARVNFARVKNYNHPEYPEFEDFGEASLTGDNGTSFYYRVDWFTPDGVKAFGDGRTLIVGTEGFIELRKFVDISTDYGRNNLYYCNHKDEFRLNVTGQVGTRFFGEFIQDCIQGTENSMSQAQAFKAAELCLKCQMLADVNWGK